MYIYKNCPNLDNYNDVVVMKNEQSYAAFMGYLSNMMIRAKTAASITGINEYAAVIMVDEKMTRPYKDQPNTACERIHALFQRMNTGNGLYVTLTFYQYKEHQYQGATPKHTVSHLFPMYRFTVDRNMMTLNESPITLRGPDNQIRQFSWGEKFKGVKIDYYTEIHEVLDMLDRSKAHFCYQGGTAWISIAMGIPTYIVHNTHQIPRRNQHEKYRMYGQELGNVTTIDNGKVVNVRQIDCEHHVTLNQAKSKYYGYS